MINIPKLKISAFGEIKDKSENLISGAQYAGVIPKILVLSLSL